MTSSKKAAASRPGPTLSRVAVAPIAALLVIACDDRPSVDLPIAYAPMLIASTITTFANPIDELPPDVATRSSQIDRDSTLRYCNSSGVPSSVNAQMKISVEPAKSPGIASGSVMRKKFRHRRPPRFSAASSIAGSIFASDACKFRYAMG